VKLNRSGRSNVQPQVFVSLVALFAVCLAFSPVTAQAQTYTPNDIYTIVGGGKTPTTPLTADLPGASAAIEDSSGNIYIAAPDSAYVSSSPLPAGSAITLDWDMAVTTPMAARPARL